jgi:hypothetical protein
METDQGFSILLGKTLKEVIVVKDDEKIDDEITFVCEGGQKYKLWHLQDCCEDVYIESMVGNIDDLIGTPLLQAEEINNVDLPKSDKEYSDDSFTWTFYKLATIKGFLTIRWYGSSNGYYSESVDFTEIEEGD